MLIAGILLGGALGALTRHGVNVALSGLAAAAPSTAFPLATLLVNVVGSFLLSFLTTAGLNGLVPPVVRAAVGTGFLGAMTTFSTFEMETDSLIRSGAGGTAALYVLANLMLGYGAILLGRMVAAMVAAPLSGQPR